MRIKQEEYFIWLESNSESNFRGLEIIFAYVVESLIILSPPSLLSASGGLLVVCGKLGSAIIHYIDIFTWRYSTIVLYKT